MIITINIPDEVLKICKDDEYFNMRVDFNANDNTIKSIKIDDGYAFTKADFIATISNMIIISNATAKENKNE